MSNKDKYSSLRLTTYFAWYGCLIATEGSVYYSLINNYISEKDCKILLEFINNKSKTETSTLLKTHLLELNHIVNRKLIKLKHNVGK